MFDWLNFDTLSVIVIVLCIAAFFVIVNLDDIDPQLHTEE